MVTLVNVGCGGVAHPEWLNFDVEPRLRHVRRLDVRRGLPLPDDSADAVYSSHVLEHLTADEAIVFFTELWRVLRPGGVIRVVVPDLEQIARNYLQQLQALKDGSAASDFAYRFSLLELLDQSVRDRSGGDMLDAYRRARGAHAAYVLARHGAEAKPYLEPAGTAAVCDAAAVSAPRPPLLQRLRWRALRACCRVIGGRTAESWIEIGRFRQSGEVHRLMYDGYSLAATLQRHRFVQPHAVAADESAIPGFARFELDAVDGVVRKPDSIFFEATKPA